VTVATEQFSYVQQLVQQRSAIVLAADKGYLVDSRLAPLARTLGVKDVNGVVDRLRASRDPKLEQQVVEAMTTNETSWFRDLRPFEALRRHIVPELIKRNASTRQIRIWSAACSTGHELYSVAMMLEETFPELRHGWQVELVGTDLNTEMVRRSTEGLFSTLEVNHGLPASLLVRYFDREGANWRANHSLRQGTRFLTLNLVGSSPVLPILDVVLLRNVLIYFDVATKRQVHIRTLRQMTPDGYVLLGTAESPNGLCDGLEPVTAEGSVFYRAKRG
jgi:chemotaxis protein methyltransferase CheR